MGPFYKAKKAVIRYISKITFLVRKYSSKLSLILGLSRTEDLFSLVYTLVGGADRVSDFCKEEDCIADSPLCQCLNTLTSFIQPLIMVAPKNPFLMSHPLRSCLYTDG